jgi:hypothetical protein
MKPHQSVEIPPPQINAQALANNVIQIQPTPDINSTHQTPQQQLQQNPASTNPTAHIPPLLPPEELKVLNEKLQEKLNEKALKQILAKDRKEFNCINCKVVCQSKSSWDAHLVSKKHRKNKHKFHLYPGISKEFVKRKYANSFVRAQETAYNEFVEDGVVFYCKRCDVRMETKLQLEVHMSSNLHKLNHPIAAIPTQDTTYYAYDTSYAAPQNNQQLFNFENSSYG